MLSSQKKIAWKLKHSKTNSSPKVTPPNPTFTSRKALALLGMIITLLAMVRIPFVGQFFDDVFFSLPFGWLKYLVYAMVLYFLGRIAFNYKLHPVLMKYTLAHIILFTGLAWLFSYLSAPFIESQYAYDVIGMELFSKFLGSWYDNSVFSSPSIEISGFFLNTMGGGMIGYAIHSVTSYSTAIGSLILSLSFISLAVSIYLTGSLFGFARITMRKIREKRELRRTKQSTYVMENQDDDPEPVISEPLSAAVASRVQKIVTNSKPELSINKQTHSISRSGEARHYQRTTMQSEGMAMARFTKPKMSVLSEEITSSSKDPQNNLDKEKLAMTLERLALHKNMAKHLHSKESPTNISNEKVVSQKNVSSPVISYDLNSTTPKMNPFGVPVRSAPKSHNFTPKKLVVPNRELFTNLTKQFTGEYNSPSKVVFAPAKVLEQHRIDINRHHHLVRVRDITEFLAKQGASVHLRNRQENHLFYHLEFTFRLKNEVSLQKVFARLVNTFKSVNLRCYLSSSNEKIVVEIAKQIPTNITFSNLNLDNVQTGNLQLHLGKDCKDNDASVDLVTSNGLFFLASSKANRDSLTKQFLVSLIYSCHPSCLQLIIAADEQLAMFTAAQQAIANIIKSKEELARTITLLDNEIYRREKLLMDLGVASLVAYNQTVDKNRKIANIVFFADEVANWEIDPAVGQKFNNLLLKGPQLGIFLILGSCEPTSGLVRGLLMKSTAKVYAGEIPSLLGLTQNLLPSNDILLQSSSASSPVRIQTPVLTSREINELLAIASANEVSNYQVVKELAPSLISDNDESSLKTSEASAESALSDRLEKEIKKFVLETRQASIPLVQQQFNLGYMQAIEYLEKLVQIGIVRKNSVTNTYKVAF